MQFIKKVIFRSLNTLFFLSIILFSACNENTQPPSPPSTQSSDKEVTQVTVGTVIVTKTADDTKGQIGHETTDQDGTAVKKAVPITVLNVADGVTQVKREDILVSEKATLTTPSEYAVNILYTGNSEDKDADPIPIVVTAEDGTKKYYQLKISKKKSKIAQMTSFKIKVGNLDAVEATLDQVATGTHTGDAPEQPLVYQAVLLPDTPYSETVQVKVGDGGLEVSKGAAITSPSSETIGQIGLATGHSGSMVTVTAEDGVTNKYYKFVLIKNAPTLGVFKLAGVLADIPKPGEVSGKDGKTTKAAIPIKILLPFSKSRAYVEEFTVDLENSIPLGTYPGQLSHGLIKTGVNFSSTAQIQSPSRPGILPGTKTASKPLKTMIFQPSKDYIIVVVDKAGTTSKKTFYQIIVKIRPGILLPPKVSSFFPTLQQLATNPMLAITMRNLQKPNLAPFQAAVSADLMIGNPQDGDGRDKDHAIPIGVVFKTGTLTTAFDVAPVLSFDTSVGKVLPKGATFMATAGAAARVNPSVIGKIVQLRLGKFGQLTSPGSGVSAPTTPATTGTAEEKGKPYVKVSIGTGEDELSTWYKFTFQAQRGS